MFLKEDPMMGSIVDPFLGKGAQAKGLGHSNVLFLLLGFLEP
jgi:hypothetical protein